VNCYESKRSDYIHRKTGIDSENYTLRIPEGIHVHCGVFGRLITLFIHGESNSQTRIQRNRQT
jgi:hypothetical protein